MSPPKSRSLVLTLILSACVLAYVFLVFLPVGEATDRLRTELRTQRKYIIQADGAFAEHDQLKQQLDEAEQFVHRWRARAPRHSALADFYASLNDLAGQAGVTIRRLVPQQPVPLSAIRQHPTQLSLEGRFDRLFEFLRSLENLPSTVWVTSLQMEQAGENGERLTCELGLTVFTDIQATSD